MKEGDIVLASLPQADGFVKNRPILLLREMQEYGHFLACGISSQLHQEVQSFDEIIEPNAQNRLKQTSIIRLGFLAIITQNQIKGRLGSISENLHNDLLHRLADYLVL